MFLPRMVLLAVSSVVIGQAGSEVAAEESKEPTSNELLAHREVQGALTVVDAWIEGVRIYDKVPGISVGFVRDQDLIWSHGYGYSNLESKRLADANTLYSICSISKLFTSIGIMQLRDADQLRLRDSVDEHLEWFDIKQAHEGSPPVSIESLLTHSSGLPRESDYSYWGGPDFPFPSREKMIESLKNQETLYPAQRYFQYSNLALSLAGEIIQARSGQKYADYIEEHILDPMELTSTRTHYPENLRGEELAIGYSGMHRDGRRDPVEPFFTRGITPAAGFTSSVNDLGRFASWQFRLLKNGGKEVLSANTLREMHRVHWVDPDWKTTWGLGFAVRQVDDSTVVGHGGGCPGYITSFSMIPERKLAVVVLTNAGDGPAGRVAQNILKILGTALKKAETPSKDARPDYSMYEGNYESRPWGGEVAIRQWGDQLIAVNIPSDDLSEAMVKLKHVSGHEFIRLTDNDEPRETVLFEMGAGQKAMRYVQHNSYATRIE